MNPGMPLCIPTYIDGRKFKNDVSAEKNLKAFNAFF